MAENFNSYSEYYDILYQDKTYSEEVDYVVDVILNVNPKSKNILELGCGSGSHAKYFSEKRFTLVGIDKSKQMIEKAEKKAIRNFKPSLGSITNFELNQKFDATISLFHVISYLVKNEEIISCFKQVNKHLNKNGLFLFDCWFTPAVYNLKPETRTKKFENEILKVERVSNSKMDLEKNTVDVQFNVTIENKELKKLDTLVENHLMRHFSFPEIELFASLAGFRILTCEELISRQKPSLNTWAVCFLLQKIKNFK